MSEILTTEEVTFCAVHPERETALRCNKCDRYMCSKCAVQTPVGYRCRECIHQIESGFYTANEADETINFVVCAALTGIGAAIVMAVNIWFFLILIVGFPFGGFVAEMALRASKRKRGRNSAQVAAAGAVVGGIAGALVSTFLNYNNYINEITTRFTEAGLNVPASLPSLSQYMESRLTGSAIELVLFVGIVAFAVHSRYKMRS